MRRCVILAFAAIAACAPSVDGPVQTQQATDRADEARLAAQLAQLPGATSASVTLRRPARDPLVGDAPATPTGGALVVVERDGDRTRVADRTKQLMHVAAPEVADPTIVVEVGRPPPKLASVGPFTVEEGSRTGLKVTLALGLLTIATLAALLAGAVSRRAKSAIVPVPIAPRESRERDGQSRFRMRPPRERK